MTLKSLLTPFIKFNVSSTTAVDGFVYVFGGSEFKQFQKTLKPLVEKHAQGYQTESLLKSEKRVVHFVGQQGPVWILFYAAADDKNSHWGYLDDSKYGWMRDQIGSLWGQFKTHKLKNVFIDLSKATNEGVEGSIVGLELANYNYLQVVKKTKEEVPAITLNLASQSAAMKFLVERAQKKSVAIQLARHLVNLPPNEANPNTIEAIIKKDLSFSKSMKVEVWNADRCKKENMNLLLAVGAGSENAPRMIRFKYRPIGAKNKKPIAFVGKGVTFDTGGLDIKPSSAMRLMKKDMGGSAAVLAMAVWVDSVKYKRACDFYLALAENSVDSRSMRPSDVYQSRAGHLVEIDNTDAEGRLVLADVMDVAVTQKGADAPEYLIDVATLTGAIKVALGADVAGLFTNDEKLSTQMMTAGQRAGEPNWRMPLVNKYWSSLSSNFADFKNSTEGFGGAITAALFLQKFCGKTKWAHLDVYCWADRSTGALASAGANGQPVQTLVEWLQAVE